MMAASTIRTFTKKPDAELDYMVDWSAWLADAETIATISWTVPGELTQPTPASHTTTSATVWLGGGTVGVDYVVACEVSTSQGRTDSRAFRVRVRA